MANLINSAYVDEFRENVLQLAQQDGSKIVYGHSRLEAQSAESLFYDQLDRVDMRPKDQAGLDRNAATVIDNPPHFRRQNTMLNWVTSAAIDDEDIVRTLNDFKSPYAQAQGMAVGRQVDKVAVEAVFGINQRQEDNTTLAPVAWANGATGFADANPEHMIGGVFGGSSLTGMTLEKLIQAKTTLMGADLVNPGPITIVMTELELADLLADPQLTSADYNTVRALVSGEINQFVGMNFVIVSSGALARPLGGDLGTPGTAEVIMPISNSDTTRCFAYCESHLLYGQGLDLSVDVARDPSINNSWRIITKHIGGATRLEEKAFVEVMCLRS